MNIYIAGKISGLEPSVFHYKFEKCREYVERHVSPVGTNIIIPTDLCQDDWTWDTCMKVCTEALINCNLVVVMDDWHTSKGAKEEIRIAKEHNIPIWFL